MPWTTPRTWVAGSAVTAAELNTDVRDNTDYLYDTLTTHGLTSDTTPQPIKSGGYGVNLYTGTDINCADATDVAVGFDSEEWDDASFHSTSSNTSRVTIPTGGDGRYLINVYTSFESNSSGRREVWFEKNAATEYSRVRLPAAQGAATSMSATIELALVAGDFVQVRVRQNSGSTLQVYARLQARRIAV